MFLHSCPSVSLHTERQGQGAKQLTALGQITEGPSEMREKTVMEAGGVACFHVWVSDQLI